jgi:hypothetical protein
MLISTYFLISEVDYHTHMKIILMTGDLVGALLESNEYQFNASLLEQLCELDPDTKPQVQTC